MSKIQLIKAHITGFGTYKDYEINFNDKINSYNKDNGFGKSTLMDFIKVMFYGMEGIRIKSHDFTERFHYAPLAIKTYGGSLDFAVTDNNTTDTYRIERSFDESKTTNDTIKLFKNNSEIKEKKNAKLEEMLQGILGVSEATYLNTLYLDNQPLKQDASLKSQIIDTIHNQSAKDYDKMIEELTNLKKGYEKEINSNSARISNDCNWLHEHQHDLQELEQCEEKAQELEDKKVALTTEQAQATHQSYINEAYHSQEKMKKYHSELFNITSLYPNGLPTKEDIECLRALEENRNGLEKSAPTPLDAMEESELKELQGYWADYTYEKYKQDKEELNKLQATLKVSALSDSEKHIDEQCQGITDEEINAVIESYNQINNPSINETNISSQNTVKKFIPLSAIALVLLLVGLVLGFLKVASPLGWIIASVSGLGLLVFLVVYVYLATNNRPMTMPIQDRAFKEQINHLNWGIIYTSYIQAKQEFDRILDSYKAIQTKKEKLTSIQKEYDDLVQTIQCQTHQCDYEQCHERYIILSQKWDAYKKALDKNALELDEVRQQIQEFYEAKNYPMTKNSHYLENDLDDYDRLNKTYEDEENHFNLILSSNHLKEEDIVLVNVRALDQINQELQNINEQRMNNQNRIKELEANSQEITEKEANVKKLQEDNVTLNQKNEICLKTLECFKAANEALATGFIGPIQTNFTAKLALLTTTLGHKVSVNNDLELTMDKDGKTLCFDQLSSGEKALVDFILRLCVIETIYNHNYPFIILDDPFMSLDNITLSKMKDLVKHLDYQVLYFTCHESRAL